MIHLSVPRNDAEPLAIELSAGETLFVLGTNGAGKSSLMFHFNSQSRSHSRWLSAHRQTWLDSGTVNLAPRRVDEIEQNFRTSDRSAESRWKDNKGNQLIQLALRNLIQRINLQGRQAVLSLRNLDFESASKIADPTNDSIQTITRLLANANLPIVLEEPDPIREEFLVRKSGSTLYSIAQLSDGERNAVLIAAEALTAQPGDLILIDEPERHLHRSIISPLLNATFAERPDCTFIISTHEVMLPVDSGASKVLLVRGCIYRNGQAATWDIDFVSSSDDIDEEIRRDILGARRAVLFVEGEEHCLDKPLYSLLFPNVSVVPKQDCRNVEHAVRSLRGSESLHWVEAYGIIDGDGREADQIERLRGEHIYSLDAYLVESIYYDGKVREATARRQAKVTGADANVRLQDAKIAALSLDDNSRENLCKRMAEYVVHRQIHQETLNRNDGMFDGPVNIQVDTQTILQQERGRLSDLIVDQNLDAIIRRYPIKQSAIPDIISRKLGFRNCKEYQNAVLQLLRDSPDMLNYVRGLFGDLSQQLSLQ